MKKEDTARFESKVCPSCTQTKCKTYYGCCKECIDFMLRYPAYPTCNNDKCPARVQGRLKEFELRLI